MVLGRTCWQSLCLTTRIPAALAIKAPTSLCIRDTIRR